MKKENPILKAVKGFFPYFATPAMLAFLIWTYATDSATNKTLMFPDVETQVETIKYMQTAPTPVDNYKAYQRLDSMEVYAKKNTDDAIEQRAIRSADVKHALDVGEKNAVQIYQMKQKQDTIIKLLRK